MNWVGRLVPKILNPGRDRKTKDTSLGQTKKVIHLFPGYDSVKYSPTGMDQWINMAPSPKAALFLMCVVLILTHDKTEVSLFTHMIWIQRMFLISGPTPRTALKETCRANVGS